MLMAAEWPSVLQFGGYYVNAKTVPRALRWIPSVSMIKHGFEGLCDNEFPGLEFDATGFGSGDVRTGDQVTHFPAWHAWYCVHVVP